METKKERNRGKELGKKYNGIYMQSYVDIVAACIKSYLLMKQALISDYKINVAEAFIDRAVVIAESCLADIKSRVDDLIGEKYDKIIRLD